MRQSPSRQIRALRLALVLGAAAPAALISVGASTTATAQAGYPAPYGARQPAPYGAQQPAPRDAASEAWAQILAKTPQSNDAALAQRVRAVGDRLVQAAGSDPRGWDYRVFADNSPNAFVLPGGRVGVNTGLFRVVQNDDQLAAVLGHEIAHNQYNHAAQRSTRTGLARLGLGLGARLFGRNDPELANRIARYGGAGAQLGFLLPFSRNQELEADRLGVDYMARAGFRPSQAVALWRNFQSARGSGSAPQFLSTHPNDATRIQQLEAYNRSRGYN
jgi:predicted Zn-dependent protease